MTALSESFSLTIIHDIFPLTIPTFLHFSQVGKPILDSFQQWHNYLQGSAHVVLMLSDHKNLEYFATTKQLTCHQVCWLEYLSGFNYLICYHAMRLGTKPDALICHKDVYPC